MPASLIHQPDEDLLASLLGPAIERAAQQETATEELQTFITPVELPLHFAVHQVHGLWEGLAEKSRAWERRWLAEAAPLREQLAEIPREERSRRRELFNRITWCDELARDGRTCARAVFQRASDALQLAAAGQAALLLAPRKFSPRKLSEITDDALVHFNELWSERCWLETTWKWTLHQCLSAALFGDPHAVEAPASGPLRKRPPKS